MIERKDNKEKSVETFYDTLTDDQKEHWKHFLKFLLYDMDGSAAVVDRFLESDIRKFINGLKARIDSEIGRKIGRKIGGDKK